MDNNELTHHGIRGMRWGVRRFQNKDGSLTAAGKKRVAENEEKTKSKAETKESKIKSRVEARKAKAIQKAEAKAAKKAAEEKAERLAKKAEEAAAKKAYEEGKEQALKTGSATDVLKYKGDLTQQEMTTAINRIRWEQDMKNISDKELASGKTKADKFFDGMSKNTDRAVTVSKAYNTFANVYNAFVGLDKGMLPTIQTDNTKSNRAQRRSEKKTFDDDKGDSKSKSNNDKASSNDEGPKDNGDTKGSSKRLNKNKYAYKEGDLSRFMNNTKDDGDTKGSSKRLNKNKYKFVESRLPKEPYNSSMRKKASALLDRKPTNNQIELGERYIAGLLGAPKEEDK